MAILLDSECLAPDERQDALDAVFETFQMPQTVRYQTPPACIRHRLELRQLGPGVVLVHNVGSGLAIDRSERQIRRGCPGGLSLSASTVGEFTIKATGTEARILPGHLSILDTTRAYSARQSITMDQYVVTLDSSQMGISVDQVRAAHRQLVASPLYEVMRSHFTSLCTAPPELPLASASALGRATAQLARAMILTAVESPDSRQCLEDTLFARMTAYADKHLHQPELNVAQIAAAHYVSPRTVYNAWTRATRESPQRWIMDRRLERAAALLADQHRSVLPISWVARQCGFTNMSHFSRRFNDAHNMSPRDWSIQHRRG